MAQQRRNIMKNSTEVNDIIKERVSDLLKVNVDIDIEKIHKVILDHMRGRIKTFKLTDKEKEFERLQNACLGRSQGVDYPDGEEPLNVLINDAKHQEVTSYEEHERAEEIVSRLHSWMHSYGLSEDKKICAKMARDFLNIKAHLWLSEKQGKWFLSGINNSDLAFRRKAQGKVNEWIMSTEWALKYADSVTTEENFFEMIKLNLFGKFLTEFPEEYSD